MTDLVVDRRLVPLQVIGTPSLIPGPPGSGSTIDVRDEGVSVGSVSRINFKGAGVAVSTSGGGAQADVDIPGGGGGGSDETIFLLDHPEAVSGGVYQASVIEALITAATGRANIKYPKGVILQDRDLRPSKPIDVDAYGPAKGQSGGTAGTEIRVPAGYNVFTLLPAAQQSKIRNVRLSQASLLTTTGVATYAPAPGAYDTFTGVTLLDTVNGQVVAIEGSGAPLTLKGRKGSVNAGSNSVTVASSGSYGNYFGYVGQRVEVTGAGFPANAYIGSLGIGGNFTVVDKNGAALNAASTVVLAAIKVYTPTIGRIVSGGGTATLVLDAYSYDPQPVTGAVIRHAACGIYGSTQFHTEHVETVGVRVGVARCGVTTGNTVADLGSDEYLCTGGAEWIGAFYQGNDGQVNGAVGADYAGPRVGVLDASLLGNYFQSCHWAFNCGLQATNNGIKIGLGYFEANTGWATYGGVFYGTESLVNGAGLQGFFPRAFDVAGPGLFLNGPVSARDDGNGAGAGSFAGAVSFGNNDGAVGAGPSVVYFTGGCTGGNRLRVIGNGANGIYLSGSTDLYLNSESGNIQLRIADVVVASGESYGINLASGKVLKVAGTQVLGAQLAALPADATDLATALTLLNAVKARMKATGGHGFVAD